MYADFAKPVPKSGGGYAYSYDALGSLGGFTAGWFLALASIFACSLYAVGFAQYFATFLGDVSHIQIIGLAPALVALSAFINSLGADSERVQLLLTRGNIAILVALVLVSLFSACRAWYIFCRISRKSSLLGGCGACGRYRKEDESKSAFLELYLRVYSEQFLFVDILIA